MFVYALARAVHRGYLPRRYLADAERGYSGILKHFIETGPGNDVSLTGTVKVGGLGGDPYRDGSYAYYLSEKVVTNDPKGVGAFLMASAEMEKPGSAHAAATPSGKSRKIAAAVKTLHVAADGTGDYSTIERALDVAPADGAVILVSPGNYREVLTVDKPNIRMRGAGADASQTIVVNNRNAGENGGTLHSATVNVAADNFVAENITFENDFNRTHPQLSQGSQALALMVTGDRAVFRNVRLLGNQDTVYAGNRGCAQGSLPCASSRQYFADCYIAGNVDFIFGDSKAVFDHCEIHSTAHAGGYITAQSKHAPDQDSGYVINHCNLTVGEGVTQSVFLGRPWRPYATVIYLNTEMGSHIDPEGWREWHPGDTHSLETAFYAEYNSTGPGAQHDKRDPHTHFLTAEQARQYETANFLRGNDNWNPAAISSR
jgi:pectin methylesterase-like acyl-CoA thioesterase